MLAFRKFLRFQSSRFDDLIELGLSEWPGHNYFDLGSHANKRQKPKHHLQSTSQPANSGLINWNDKNTRKSSEMLVIYWCNCRWKQSSMLYEMSLECWLVQCVQRGHQFRARKQFYVKCVTTKTYRAPEKKHCRCDVRTILTQMNPSSFFFCWRFFSYGEINSLFSSWIHLTCTGLLNMFQSIRWHVCPSAHSGMNALHASAAAWFVGMFNRFDDEWVCILQSRSCQRVPSILLWRHSAPSVKQARLVVSGAQLQWNSAKSASHCVFHVFFKMRSCYFEHTAPV